MNARVGIKSGGENIIVFLSLFLIKKTEKLNQIYIYIYILFFFKK